MMCPKKKMKVSRLMKFMDKNKDFIQVGDDFEILIRNRPIPGLDFHRNHELSPEGARGKSTHFHSNQRSRNGDTHRYEVIH